MGFIKSSLGIAVSLFLFACSGTDTTTPGPTAPPGNGKRGAVNLEIFQAQGEMCPIGDVHVDIGVASASPPQEIADGTSGAAIECTVAPKGMPMDDAGQSYGAQGSLKMGTFVFSFATDLTSDIASTTGGQLHVADPKTGTDYASTTCVFEYTPGTNNDLGGGRFAAEFACNTLTSSKNPSDTCAARTGYVVVEGCATE